MPLGQTSELALRLFRKYRLQRLPDTVIAPEVVPVILLDDLSDLNVQGRRQCMGVSYPQAVAGEFSFSALVNNLRENIVVNGVGMTTYGVAMSMTIMRTTVSLSGLSADTDKAFVDFTIPGQPQAALSHGSDPAAIAGRAMFEFDPLFGLAQGPQYVFVPLNVTLFGGPPGDAGPGGAGSRQLVVQNNTVNTPSGVNWFWTEGTPEG